MNLATTKILAPQLRPNLLPSFCDFDTPHTWNKISGDSDVSVVSSALNPYGGTGHARVNFNITTTAKRIVFSSGGDEMKYTATKTGVHAVSFMLWVGSTDTLIVALNVFKNGIATKYETNFMGDLAFKVGYNKVYQTFEAELGDEIDFTFELTSDTKRYADVDAMKLELIDDNIYLPSAYSRTEYLNLIWQSRVDTTNTQNIIANTNTNFGFVGTSESNDTATLLTTTGLITPSKEKAVVTVDYAFNFDAPSGADRFVDVFLNVNGITYRAETYTMTKDAGDTEYISGSFTLPVGADFKQYGAQIVINSSVAITIKNRYISVIQHRN